MSSVTILDASDHPLTSVTVFKSSKAEIARSFKLSLKKGQNKVEIHNLPGSIDTESARITGLRDLQLFDVVCTNTENLFAKNSLSESIRLLKAKKSTLVAEKNAISSATYVLESYSKTLKSDDVSPEQADAFLDTYLKRARKLVKEGAELEEQILEVEKEIKKEKEQRDKKKGNADGMVSVVVMAKGEVEAEFKLTYIVYGASWSPSYELHAITDSGKPSSSVSLHYRASITQTTGEDWSNVALTLSTVSMDHSDQQVPTLNALCIRPPTLNNVGSYPIGIFAQQTQQQQQQPAGSAFGLFGSINQQHPPPAVQSLRGGRGGMGGALFGATRSTAAPPGAALSPTLSPRPAPTLSREEEDEDEDWDEAPEAADGQRDLAIVTPGTVINESPLSISYTVEGQSSIPTDGVAHKVSVTELNFETKVILVAVPRVRAQAYLQAQVKNTSDYRLLPGPVTIFMNDSYVSRTSIQDIGPGDSFDCTFGPDTSTRISYTRNVKRTTAAASAFTEQYTTATFVSIIKVHNRHAFAIDKIILRDALAVSDDEKKVKVLLKRPEALLKLDERAEKESTVSEKDEIFEGGSGEKCIVRWQDAKDGKGGRKEGLFEWICEGVEAGKEISMETEWDVRAPADVKWVETQA